MIPTNTLSFLCKAKILVRLRRQLHAKSIVGVQVMVSEARMVVTFPTCTEKSQVPSPSATCNRRRWTSYASGHAVSLGTRRCWERWTTARKSIPCSSSLCGYVLFRNHKPMFACPYKGKVLLVVISSLRMRVTAPLERIF